MRRALLLLLFAGSGFGSPLDPQKVYDLTIGGNVQQAKLVMPKPLLPGAAKEARIQGTVVLQALIGLDGAVLGLNPESGPSELVDSAIAAVSRWRYQPTLLSGKPCFVMTRIAVTYALSH
jgi:outer membrane biosynthesis protein TonB